MPRQHLRIHRPAPAQRCICVNENTGLQCQRKSQSPRFWDAGDQLGADIVVALRSDRRGRAPRRRAARRDRRRRRRGRSRRRCRGAGTRQETPALRARRATSARRACSVQDGRGGAGRGAQRSTVLGGRTPNRRMGWPLTSRAAAPDTSAGAGDLDRRRARGGARRRLLRRPRRGGLAAVFGELRMSIGPSGGSGSFSGTTCAGRTSTTRLGRRGTLFVSSGSMSWRSAVCGPTAPLEIGRRCGVAALRAASSR